MGNLSVVRKLREAGAGVDGSCQGISIPLTAAADRNRFDILEYLLEQGADIEGVNGYHQTALQNAVEENSHECISLLIRLKANYRRINDRVQTILHIAALGADLETLDILEKNGLRGLDPTLRDSSGKTALQVHELYGLKDPVIRQAFANLIRAVEHSNRLASEPDEEAVFYDAHE